MLLFLSSLLNNDNNTTKVQAQVKDLARKMVSPKFVEAIASLLDTPHWRSRKYVLDLLNAVFSIEALLLNDKMEDEIVFVKEARPRCPDGVNCQSADPSHFMEFQHTSEAPTPDKAKEGKEDGNTDVSYFLSAGFSLLLLTPSTLYRMRRG